MTRAPDIDGPVARAWRISNKGTKRPEQEATVAAWLVNGPFHPCWSYWMVSVVHLRPIEGAPPAMLSRPDASHESLILSLQSPPGHALIPDPEDRDTILHLTPPDCVQQVVGLTDEQAERLCDLIAVAACNGESLDSDFRASWQRSILATAEHYRLGVHDATA